MIRYNILTNDAARADFIEGVHRLKRQPWRNGLSHYDFFVDWHFRAMMEATPFPPVPAGSSRNAAHNGPVFLPWHRYMLWVLEFALQRALGKPEFRLPYWDFTADAADPGRSWLWSPHVMGGTGPNGVGSGPFQRFSPDGRQWEVRLAADANLRLVRTSRPLRRDLGRSGRIASAAVAQAAVSDRGVYDRFPWDGRSGGTFRHELEVALHGPVHNWVGMDMSTATSPNDPVFFLLHCNVDRLWRSWQGRHGVGNYLPGADAPAWLYRHRLGDPMHSPYSRPVTPRAMLDVDGLYEYDELV